MDKLWAPWRVKYIRQKKQAGCVFCRALKKQAKEYVLFRTVYSMCILNIFPYNNGHVMVSPRRHTSDLNKLSDAEAMDLFRCVARVKSRIDKCLSPDGYNIGVNLSAAAGAGIPGHLHIHIVPRWKGDTNFMPVIHDTKIISQSLDELYNLLKDEKR